MGRALARRRSGSPSTNVTFPDNVKARAKYWLPFIDELGADERTILIGHSSGAVAAMRYAETHRLLGSVLVGVCHTDWATPSKRRAAITASPGTGSGSATTSSGWQSTVRPTMPHIPIAEPRFVAAQLGCSYFEFTDRGHFVDTRELPEVVQFITRKLSL